jgi:beta-galactosidase
LRSLGLNVDILPPGTDLEGYKLVVIPCLPVMADALGATLSRFEGQIVIGPRTATRDPEFAIPSGLVDAGFANLLGGKIVRSESLSDRLQIIGDGWTAKGWLDHYEGAAEPEFVASSGEVCSYRHRNVRLSCVWPEGSMFDQLVERAARDAGLPNERLPKGIRRRTCGTTLFTFDYLTAQVSLG